LFFTKSKGQNSTTEMDKTKKIYLTVFFITLAVSAIKPHDYFTWFLEIVPALIALVILVATFKRFQFSNFIYGLILFHSIVLMIGGHWTYAEVPFGYWIRDIFNFSRNHYDRFGHLMQGFVPALVARELILKNNIIPSRKWMNFFIIFTILGFSAFYEFFEWGMSVATGEAANSFLGTQGDVWDTQWDMFMCLIGSTSALLTMSRFHDRFLGNLKK
jgi:putative membrane protein